ncbi:hypothetical protein [Streptosporangium sp. NPDC051022]|uniref:hypothetical protein n=1 Tax=Streptosporangium sp. NPDC051022 TaxID=3155752 RepID=UPI0034163EE0
MDLSPYVDQLRHELTVAAEAGGKEVVAATRRLTASLESATRLVLLEALSAAADEITCELAPGSVEIRLRRRDPEFVVTPPPSNRPFEDTPESTDGGIGATRSGTAAADGAAPQEAEEGGTSRLSLRVPEHLKPRIEEAAGREGLSVNAWLVRAVSSALEPRERRNDSAHRTDRQSGQRYTGWVR